MMPQAGGAPFGIGVSAIISNPAKVGHVPLISEIGDDAGDRVSDVVMCAGRMVDAVFAGASDAALQPDELLQQLRMVEKIGLLGVHQGQEVAIEIGLRLGRAFIGDEVRAELRSTRGRASIISSASLGRASTPGFPFSRGSVAMVQTPSLERSVHFMLAIFSRRWAVKRSARMIAPCRLQFSPGLADIALWIALDRFGSLRPGAIVGC